MVPHGGILLKTESFMVHQDPEVPLKGFMIIATRAHIRSILELSEKENLELAMLIRRVRAAMANVIPEIEDVTILQEERSGHYHLWLLPWYDWMSQRFPHTFSSIRPLMKDLEQMEQTDEEVNEIIDVAKRIQKELTGSIC